MERSAAQVAIVGVGLALIGALLCSQWLPADNGPNNTVVPALDDKPASTARIPNSTYPRSRPAIQFSRRAVSEKDAIGMRVLSGPGASSNYGGTLDRNFAIFSPDGSKFLITLKRGNLHNNSNEYSLLLYHTGQLFRSPRPVLLVSMSSSSNREAIKDVSWLGDSNTVLFLGEHPGEQTQLYSIWCPSRTVTRLSNHPTNLVAYSADSFGRTVVYYADKPAKKVIGGRTLRYGFHVTDQSMADLIASQIQDDERELYVWRSGARPRRLFVPEVLGGKLWGESGEMSLSPNGRELVVKINLTTIADSWRAYRDPWLHRGIVQYRPPGAPSWGISLFDHQFADWSWSGPAGFSSELLQFGR